MRTLQEAIRPTTFIESEKLRNYLGIDLTIASETFQHTGSFKFRAGYNLASSVDNDHIITASSGNFGQALAHSCQLLGKKCHVVMPENSARVKVEAVRNYGAIADLIDTRKVSRSDRVSQLVSEFPGSYRASAYDDLFVIEGNATIGGELSNKNFDAVIAPIGGGGLASGIIKGLCESGDHAQVFAAEPLLANDAARSLRAGKIVLNEEEPQTIADGARTLSVGAHNWKILQTGLAGIIEVKDQNICEALRLFFNLVNLKVEPTGALSLGAILENREAFMGKRVCLVVSGGNVDAEVFGRIING